MSLAEVQTRRAGERIAPALALILALVGSCAKEPTTEPGARDAETTRVCSAHRPEMSIGEESRGLRVSVTDRRAEPTVAPGPVPLTGSPEIPTQDDRRYERLFRLFPALKGWTQDTPRGRSTPGAGGVMAQCEYRNPVTDQSIVAKIVVGPLTQAMVRTMDATRRAVSDPQLVQSHCIEGIDATLFRDTVTEGQWILTAVLCQDKNAVLSISFRHLPPEQCLELARQFDWKSLTAYIPHLGSPMPRHSPERPI